MNEREMMTIIDELARERGEKERVQTVISSPLPHFEVPLIYLSVFTLRVNPFAGYLKKINE